MHGAGIASPGMLQQLQRAQLQRLLTHYTLKHTPSCHHKLQRYYPCRTQQQRWTVQARLQKEEHCKQKQARNRLHLRLL
jgi:hypothetical protein